VLRIGLGSCSKTNMYVHTYSTFGKSSEETEQQLRQISARPPAWVLMYGPHDAPFQQVTSRIGRQFPGVPVFGATSYQGVFTPSGFSRDIALLVGEARDCIKPAVSLQKVGPAKARESSEKACLEIEHQLGRRPNTLLLHATPGFEERILEGVQRAYGNDVPVYGGSAADDNLAGHWQVFANKESCVEGFLLVGIWSTRLPQGSFLGGYLPSEHSGTITKVEGRVVLEIDGHPAAATYNQWTDGVITQELNAGGKVLLKTNLLPLARTVGDSHGMPRRLLSHPHEVFASNRGLSFFTEFSVGDRVTLMTSTKNPLVTRVGRAAQRARSASKGPQLGGLLIYCGGCLASLLDQADRIASEFDRELEGAPFIGISTFGEQGAFFTKAESWHGNLMCSAMVF
jgi:hypothetical protein